MIKFNVSYPTMDALSTHTFRVIATRTESPTTGSTVRYQSIDVPLAQLIRLDIPELKEVQGNFPCLLSSVQGNSLYLRSLAVGQNSIQAVSSNGRFVYEASTKEPSPSAHQTIEFLSSIGLNATRTANVYNYEKKSVEYRFDISDPAFSCYNSCGTVIHSIVVPGGKLLACP